MKNIKYIESNFKKIKDKNYLKYQNLHKKNFGKLKKELLFEISNSLNKLHYKNYSVTQWRILVGPWLNIVLNIYFYYNFFSQHFSNKNKLKLKSNNKVNFYPPLDYVNFFKIINIKKNQLYFFKIILNKNKNNKKNKNDFMYFFNHKDYFYLKILNLFIKKSTILLTRSRFLRSQIASIIIKSFFRILPLINLSNYMRVRGINYNFNKRKKFLDYMNKKNSKIIEFFMNLMPSSYIENFDLYEKIAKENIKQPKTIYTDTAHLDDDLLKHMMLYWSSTNNKTNIYLGQHGGNHRIHNDYVTNYNDDYNICTKCFVWGKPLKKKEIRSSSNRLFNLKKNQTNFNKIKFDVCYVFEAMRENQFQGDFKRNDDYIRSLNTKRFFLKNLKRHFIIKPYFDKNRYPDQLTVNKLSQMLKIEKNKFKNSKEVIFQSNIIILDYLSTMIFELICLNVPFIVILDKSHDYFSDIGKNFCKELKRMKLMYNDPKKALRFVDNLKKNKNWWFTKEHQRKILKLKKSYAFTSKNHTNDWYKGLIK